MMISNTQARFEVQTQEQQVREQSLTFVFQVSVVAAVGLACFIGGLSVSHFKHSSGKLEDQPAAVRAYAEEYHRRIERE